MNDPWTIVGWIIVAILGFYSIIGPIVFVRILVQRKRLSREMEVRRADMRVTPRRPR